MARANQDIAADAASIEQPTHRDVIIQRPHGVTDSHIYIGFNDLVDGQFPYDTKISLPIVVIEHLRRQRSVEYRPGPDSQPVPSYHNSFAVMDA